MGDVTPTKAHRARALTNSLTLAIEGLARCRELLINADTDADDLAEYDAITQSLQFTLNDWLETQQKKASDHG